MNNLNPTDLPSSSGNMYNSPNMQQRTVSDELSENQQPLGSKYLSYELSQAPNSWILDPFQYSITKFDYNLPGGLKNVKENGVNPKDFKNNPGLIYKDIDFEKLLPTFTQTKKSVNDFRAQDYHRFEANNGYFNPKEKDDNSDLWYYGSDKIAKSNGLGIAGAPLNVQEPKHIIFPEPQRGGLDSKNLAKYSWSNYTNVPSESWESQNNYNKDNNTNCQFFNYNTGYSTDRSTQPFENVYNYDSNYCRNIGISSLEQGSMPFNT